MAGLRQEGLFARIYDALQDGNYKKALKCAESGVHYCLQEQLG
jgi:hypothetical protein